MRGLAVVTTVALTLPIGTAANAQPPPQATPEQRVATLKQWLQASQAQLRAYEWIETTTVAKGGEEKSKTEKRCYYGADGKLQKLPISSGESGPAPPSGPLKKKVAERKKEELTAYMKQAVELVHAYLPPDPARIQQAVNTGRLNVTPLDGGRRVRLQFRDYLKAGDTLAVEIDNATNRLIGMQVSSYLQDNADVVLLNVGMGVLQDGTIYTARTQLDAKAKDLAVIVENTGYRRRG